MKKFEKILSKLAKNLRKEASEKKMLKKFDLVLSLKSKKKPRKATEDENEVQKILSKIAHDSEFLNVVREKPEALMQEFVLDKDDIAALKAADMLVMAQLINPLLQQADDGPAGTIYLPDGTITGNLPDTGYSTVTTDTGSTCTVTNSPIVSIASTVESLKEKDSVYLSSLIQRLVEDDEFYGEVRDYFGLS